MENQLWIISDMGWMFLWHTFHLGPAKSLGYSLMLTRSFFPPMRLNWRSFFLPLLWTCVKWQGTTAPLLQKLQPETNEQRKSGTGEAEEATELPPKSLRATYLSAPLWASHILACTCLWRSRSLVRPSSPTPDSPLPSLLQELRWGLGIPIHPEW